MIAVIPILRNREPVNNTDGEGSVCTLKASLVGCSHAAQQAAFRLHPAMIVLKIKSSRRVKI